MTKNWKTTMVENQFIDTIDKAQKLHNEQGKAFVCDGDKRTAFWTVTAKFGKD